MKDFFLFNQ